MDADQKNIDEELVIVKYDSNWPVLFNSEKELLLKALSNAVTNIEHFGSTAVKGMACKPIVDLLVGVKSLETAIAKIPLLESLGYENFGEVFFRGRIYLRKRSKHNFNLAITVKGGSFWTDQIILRDYLRTHQEEAKNYSAYKYIIFKSGKRLFSTYSQAKDAFLNDIKNRSKQWYNSTI
ncbi:MAG: GrpB family protein [Ignavibacteriales bacterium]|nr:GrpB family protein [Ignavibacteriales bacterium]